MEESDVQAFGLTDYFSAETQIRFIEYFRKKYPQSPKLLLINVELRLAESVNKKSEQIDYHLIFSNTVTPKELRDFLHNLRTETTDHNGRKKNCSELSATDFESVTVTRGSIQEAFERTFGPKPNHTDRVIYCSPINGNGIRAQTGNMRKAQLSDEVDKFSDAFFGNSKSSEHFLRSDRYEDKNQISAAKPVFSGSDAHNFEDLERWTGRSISGSDNDKITTWIKADLSFAGLQQALIEPAERVRLQDIKPDSKPSYQVISHVTFHDQKSFPERIDFNPNLNSIIGSRSSGKSSLLAYISHAIDPEVTEQLLSETTNGPAAGISWNSPEASVGCVVHWANGETSDKSEANGTIHKGKVIYIPQSSLYRLSENPQKITDKIRPILFRIDPELKNAHDLLESGLTDTNEKLKTQIEKWFYNQDEIISNADDIKDVGDQNAINAEIQKINDEITSKLQESTLSAVDQDRLDALLEELSSLDKQIATDTDILDTFKKYCLFTEDNDDPKIIDNALSVTIETNPPVANLPLTLQESVKNEISSMMTILRAKIEQLILDQAHSTATCRKNNISKLKQLRNDNESLLKKQESNALLGELNAKKRAQVDKLEKLKKLDSARKQLHTTQKNLEEDIRESLEQRKKLLSDFEQNFNSKRRSLDALEFGIETDFSPEEVARISELVNRRKKNDFSSPEDGINIKKCQDEPISLLNMIQKGKLVPKGTTGETELGQKILSTAPSVRFTAALDSDTIGGFSRSSMTPGKQALFALTLIMNENQSPWPLLIDQPEDDLDSRSIYEAIVPYIQARKRERQILMVTHNANLAIGADSENVIVANRHGIDRKNPNNRTFNYITGPLEHSESKNLSCNTILESAGIREHACEILDGGKEAFEKRKHKYQIKN
ncbi:hypothetical protein JTE88_03660 [Arcanobacterium phocisimile]|uniref:DNA repair protein n=1 Tax=Arcanobacterium phocisimile TaxID=1302235 RepID=A0ABX7II81_9ACTO|nr:hypothetical protein [Arcanobacterium phocisimile]QRV02831.1 hypothetical protein JTE88_03660 [Arcanobacterium phocisimile]